MPKSKPIQISIPNPCHQSWDEMTPQGQGRHCAHCQKVVTDFTNWSDTALYEFFSKNTVTNVCGRIYKSQLKHPIYPAKQSSSGIVSKLAAGVAIVIATLEAGTENNAYARTPYVHTSPIYDIGNADAFDSKPGLSATDTILISGTVTNNVKHPVFRAMIYIFNNDEEPIAGTTTNENGEFVIKILKPENISSHSLYVNDPDYLSKTIQLTSKKINSAIHITLEYDNEIIMGGIGGLFYNVPMQPAPKIKNKQ